MASFQNYIRDTNPFNLAGPPNYFLRQLWEYDPSLVLMPSRQGFFYRLAQRRPLKLNERMVNDVLKEQADTRMLASHSLVPITTVVATCRWDDPAFFLELNRRAPWRMGGAKKFEQALIEQDKKELLEKRAKIVEHTGHLAKDAWNYYNKLIGLRTHAFQLKTKAETQASDAPAVIIPQSVRDYKPTLQSGWGDTLRKGSRTRQETSGREIPKRIMVGYKELAESHS